MNMIMLLIVAVVVFAYYGGASCPKILKDNKQMLLGVLVGLFLVNFLNGNNVEGFDTQDWLYLQRTMPRASSASNSDDRTCTESTHYMSGINTHYNHRIDAGESDDSIAAEACVAPDGSRDTPWLRPVREYFTNRFGPGNVKTSTVASFSSNQCPSFGEALNSHVQFCKSHGYYGDINTNDDKVRLISND